MFVAQVPRILVVVAIFGVVAIFLFPIPRGPYPAVHGPVTAMLNLGVKVKLWLGLALAVLKLSGYRRLSNCFATLRTRLQEFLLPLSVLPEESTILRC